MNKNRIRICGRKITTAPTPPMIPSTSRLRKGPSGMNASIVADSQAMAASIASMGSLAQEKTALNMSSIHERQDQRAPDFGA